MKENVSGCFFLNTVYIATVTVYWPIANTVMKYQTANNSTIFQQSCQKTNKNISYSKQITRTCWVQSVLR